MRSAPASALGAISLTAIAGLLRVAAIFLLLFAYTALLVPGDEDPEVGYLGYLGLSDSRFSIFMTLAIVILLFGLTTWLLASATWSFMNSFLIYSTGKMVRAEVLRTADPSGENLLHLRLVLVARSAIAILGSLVQACLLLISLLFVSWVAFVFFLVLAAISLVAANTWGRSTARLVEVFELASGEKRKEETAGDNDNESDGNGKFKLAMQAPREGLTVDAVVEQSLHELFQREQYKSWARMRSSMVGSSIRSGGSIFILFALASLVPLLVADQFPEVFSPSVIAPTVAVVVVLGQVVSSLAGGITKFGKFLPFLSRIRTDL
ncbi:hypothetical protein N9J37_00800 [Pontimonas sp.]|nr:hypothetical protein [Pontimonas sp.]